MITLPHVLRWQHAAADPRLTISFAFAAVIDAVGTEGLRYRSSDWQWRLGMYEEFAIWMTWTLGLDEDELGFRHMAVRAIVVFAVAVMLVRLGSKRFISGNTAYDVILGVMLGSIISRAITGQSPFLPTLCAALVIVVLHRLFSRIAVSSDYFGTLIKGNTSVLVRDGEVDWEAMKRSNLSRNDLLETLRLRENLSDWEEVKEARLERNGEISVIRKDGYSR